jgi:Calx-beta domain
MTLQVSARRLFLPIVAALALFFGLTTLAHAQPGNVAVFNNPQFIDNDNQDAPTEFEAEGPNTIASLQSFGENVTAFTDFSAAGFSAALAGKDSLVIPEEEPQSQEVITLRGVTSDCLDAFMDDDARNVIRNFVNAGGQLVVLAVGEDDCNATLVNHIFNWSLGTSDETDAIHARGKGLIVFNKTPDANGTEWQDGPASIPENDATGVVLESTLPAVGGKSIYSDGQGDAAVSVVPAGDGSVGLLGYDWFNSSPPNPVLATTPSDIHIGRAQTRGGEPGQDFGWQDVLRRSVDLPLLNVNDVSLNEGNSGNTAFGFTVSTSQNHSENVKASFATADGSAKAGSDYTAGSGGVTVARFTGSSPLTVNVTGDTAIEPNETFSVNLAGAYPAAAGKPGAGAIVNDDFAAPKVRVAGVRSACISKAIRVRFSINTSSTLKSVRVTLDGKRVASTKKKRFTVGVNAKKLTAGRHRLVVVATDTAGKKTTLRRTISVCAAAKPRHQTGPRFTG